MKDIKDQLNYSPEVLCAITEDCGFLPEECQQWGLTCEECRGK